MGITNGTKRSLTLMLRITGAAQLLTMLIPAKEVSSQAKSGTLTVPAVTTFKCTIATGIANGPTLSIHRTRAPMQG